MLVRVPHVSNAHVGFLNLFFAQNGNPNCGVRVS